ncbi:MAG: nucleotidyltransferase family protein [Ramlibacter sp.]
MHRQGHLTPVSPAQFIEDVLRNNHNRALLSRMAGWGLPDAWLVAGCLFQTVWNLRSGQPPEAQIKDYDLFYFDAGDLSEEAEQSVNRRLQAACADLPIEIEAKNQARVHTWYPACFGHPYPALRDSRDGMNRFLVRCTCVGLQSSGNGGAIELYAPHGLDDLYGGMLSPNPLCDHPALFAAKAASYRARWPWLRTCAMARDA